MENLLMIKYSIVLVPFPFDDFSSSKVRPALCLTSEIGSYSHIIIAFISSRVPNTLSEYDIIIRKGSTQWEGSGLIVDSVIRLHKMVTIPKSAIQRELGEINSLVKEDIVSKLKKLFEHP
ncbi:MAG: type II toxin-antitoxin system PemK/MazF family toxin [Cyclobacteriaceae bacterium]|nr:type II toxin-antitoxin system PemK/MazF family toxin [Cyclobacteriaceae bacterium]